ncbi:MAG: hypothetical protein ACI9HK_000333 [Pirellulaceae bacterium]|jgi:hypothetical protein
MLDTVASFSVATPTSRWVRQVPAVLRRQSDS